MTKLKLTPSLQKQSFDVIIPGSKSFSNRALLIAAIADGESCLKGVSPSDDSIIMVKALQQLGFSITESNSLITIVGGQSKITPRKCEINVGAAGTTSRFLTALIAALPGIEVILSGTERLHQRPIADLVTALQKLGAQIEYLQKEGCAPLKITGKVLSCDSPIEISGTTSSQFISALLMISPLVKNGLKLKIKGDLVSKSYVDMTRASMQQFGVEIENDNYQFFCCSNKSYTAGNYAIEGDASGASYFWALAALAQAKIKVYNISPNSLQGDAAFPQLLKAMGCKVSSETCQDVSKSWIAVEGTSQLLAIDCDMQLMPDTAQTLAVVAACAEGNTTITGLQTLKVKETDRLAALQIELAKLGVTTEIDSDRIVIFGKQNAELRSACIDTYEDHRMAMCFSCLGASRVALTINNPDVVSKSFPEFWNYLSNLGIEISCA